MRSKHCQRAKRDARSPLPEAPMNRIQSEAQTDWRFSKGVVYKSPYELAPTTY